MGQKTITFVTVFFSFILILGVALPLTQATMSGDSAETHTVMPKAGGDHGYIHVSEKDPHYFEFDDGTPFIPVGMNAATWFNETVAQQMNASNMNLARVWMCSWHIDIEPQLGVYNESEAQKLDDILQLAEQYDIYIQLCLLEHRDYADIGISSWYDNPYSNISGVDEPVDFFTNPTAIQYIKARFNYILNRWGNSTRIAMWEFWNEMSVVGDGGPWSRPTDEISKAWHEEVAQVFRQNDTHRRPLTTSFHGGMLWDLTFNSTAIDVIQIHTWASGPPADKALVISGYIKLYLQSTFSGGVPVPYYQGYFGTDFGKPVMIGEFGEVTGEVLETLYAGVWAAWASGSGGSSLWWFSYANFPEEMYNCYKYFHDFVEDVPWPSLSIGEGTGKVVGASNVNIFSIQGKGFALAWIQNAASGTVSGAKVELRDLSTDDYTVYVYNDSSGVYLEQYNATISLGNITIDLPDFTTHLAVKLVGTVPKDVAEWAFDPGVNGEAYIVNASSNSSLTEFSFDAENKKISFFATGPLNTTGFFNLTIPKALMTAATDQWTVMVDGELVTSLVSENDNYTFVYLTYNHSNHLIKIEGIWAVPDAPAYLILPLLLVIALAASIRERKHRLCQSKSQI